MYEESPNSKRVTAGSRPHRPNSPTLPLERGQAHLRLRQSLRHLDQHGGGFAGQLTPRHPNNAEPCSRERTIPRAISLERTPTGVIGEPVDLYQKACVKPREVDLEPSNPRVDGRTGEVAPPQEREKADFRFRSRERGSSDGAEQCAESVRAAASRVPRDVIPQIIGARTIQAECTGHGVLELTEWDGARQIEERPPRGRDGQPMTHGNVVDSEPRTASNPDATAAKARVALDRDLRCSMRRLVQDGPKVGGAPVAEHRGRSAREKRSRFLLMGHREHPDPVDAPMNRMEPPRSQSVPDPVGAYPRSEQL